MEEFKNIPKKGRIMKNLLTSLTFTALIMFICVFSCSSPTKKGEFTIIPKPKEIRLNNENFKLNSKTVFHYDDTKTELKEIADYFNSQIQSSTELNLIHDNSKKENIIELLIEPESVNNKEAYILEIQTGKITIKSNSPQGVFYGINSLLQILPSEILGNKPMKTPITIQGATIIDDPRFSYRGVMLDVSRHFFPKEDIIKIIKTLAFHKINVFHWHLVDDQGWRIEIKKYPKLTEVGAWRVDREDCHWNSRENQKPGEEATYGGYYTQEEIKEIVEIAKKHYIEIIPEIEMPAHVTSALAAYPELSCTGGPFTVAPGGLWPITDIYCAGNDEVFNFLENVLSEVFDLFPSEYIHIGGDEADKSEWKKCPKCRKRMKKENLQDVHELQSYFVKRMESFIHQNKKKLIGWDEIVEGGLPERAIVMSWRGMENGIEAAKKGYHVIMTPTSHCYLDYYQGDPAYEPLAIGGYVPLSKIYSFDPVPDTLSPEAGNNILGAQANLWTEYVPDIKHAEYMLYPRVCALAEITWSPEKSIQFDDFSIRLKDHLKRLKAFDIHYSNSIYQVTFQASYDTVTSQIQVQLKNELDPGKIRYTLDGQEPTLHSELYKTPIMIDKTTEIKAAYFDDSMEKPQVFDHVIKIHKGLGKDIQLTYPASPKYPGSGRWTLLNCLRGTESRNQEDWLGFEGTDFEAVVDLKEPIQVNNISIGFLNSQGAWIFLPTKIEFYISKNGKDYDLIKEIEHPLNPKESNLEIVDFSAEVKGDPIQYLKIKAVSTAECPEWHQGAGDPAWLFVDEIVID